MNNDRRKQIEQVRNDLDGLKADVESLRDEEQDYYDNMPESFQGGEKGDAASDAIANLEAAYDALDEALNALEEATA